MHTSFAGFPVWMQFPTELGCSKGKHRMVAPVFSLISFSSSSEPSQAHLAHFPSSIVFSKSAIVAQSTMFSSRNFLAFSNIASWISSKITLIFSTNDAFSAETPNSLPSLPGTSLLATTHAFFSTSLGPISIRIGTPFISQKLNFHPGDFVSSASIFTRMPASFNIFVIASHDAITDSLSLFFCQIGVTMTCTGANFGGNVNPLSSPCVIITPPIIRVLTPQEL
mmetsp:Transcript_5001/g.17087  ORF Transcript_5001/g.17087 Transcript_5001/m.17087 type:complete len:224 (+) Transcript_5001:93-764(+)